MANYFTHFSCLFDVGAPENLEPALAIYERHAQALDAENGIDIGFRAETDPHAGPSVLWLSSDEAGDPEHVIAFVIECAETFDLGGRWGFAGR